MNMKTLLLITVLASPAWAAINAASQWEIRTTGLSTNGGCWYNSGGSSTDYSQQDAPQLSLTDVTSNAAGTAWGSVTGGFTANMVGNCVRLTSGTNFTVGTYQIVGFTDGNNITVDRDSTSGASASAGNINIGGGLIDTWTVAPAYVAGNTVWIKNGTYTRTSTLWAIATTCTAAAPCYIIGYNSTHGDGGTQPVFTSATNSITLWTVNAASFTTIRNIKFTHTAATRGLCISAVTANSNLLLVESSYFDGCSVGFDGNTIATNYSIVKSYFTNSTTNAVSNGNIVANVRIFDSVCYNNVGSCYTTSNNGTTLHFLNNVASTNTNGIHFSTTSGSGSVLFVRSSSFDSNTASGIKVQNGVSLSVQNSIFWGNTTDGVNFVSDTPGRLIANNNNAYGGNGTDRTNLPVGTGDVTLTGSPFVSATNWGLNNTAGAGASCRAAAFPGAMQDGTTVGYLDIGAVQHQDAGGAAVTRAFPFVQ